MRQPTDLETLRWQASRGQLGGEFLHAQRLCLCLRGNHCVELGLEGRGEELRGRKRRRKEVVLVVSLGVHALGREKES